MVRRESSERARCNELSAEERAEPRVASLRGCDERLGCRLRDDVSQHWRVEGAPPLARRVDVELVDDAVGDCDVGVGAQYAVEAARGHDPEYDGVVTDCSTHGEVLARPLPEDEAEVRIEPAELREHAACGRDEVVEGGGRGSDEDESRDGKRCGALEDRAEPV